MPSQYLTGGDLATYGVPNATTNQIIQASALVDAHLKRPEGLIWVPDATGLPGWMAALAPTLSLALGAAIAPGSSVPVQLGAAAQQLSVGDVVVLDRGNNAAAEACVVATTTGPNGALQITLQNVQFAHAQSATVETGLVIEEQKYMPEDRPITFLSRPVLARVISGVGRYGYGRRGDAANYNMEQFNLLAAVSKFGGPPSWELFQQPLYNSWDANTGQVWIPAGIMLAYYSEVKLRYLAGFSTTTLPSTVKQACATIIQASAGTQRLGNVKSYKAGDTQIEMMAASVLDEDTKAALQPFAARMFV